MLDQKDKVVRDNPGWCKNPQYFVNLDKPTHVKIILRKTGQLKRLRNIKTGMTICRFETPTVPSLMSKSSKAMQDKDNKKIDNLQRLLKQTSQQLKPPVM